MREVEHRTFSGDYAVKRGQPVLYVTERCVLRLTPTGLALIEVAPGIDIERDILAHMEFAPDIADPQPMDPRIFTDEPIGLRELMLEVPLAERFSYDKLLNMLFMNFERLVIRSDHDIARIQAEVEGRILPLGRKVYAIVNYSDCTVEPGILASYLDMVEALNRSCYIDVTRYGLSGSLAVALSGPGAKKHAWLGENALHLERPEKVVPALSRL